MEEVPKNMQKMPESSAEVREVAMYTQSEKDQLINEIIHVQNQVRNFMLKFTRGNHALADDFTQEAVIRGINKIDSFKHGGKIRTWLTRIAINAARDYYRKAENKNTFSLSDFNLNDHDDYDGKSTELEKQLPTSGHEQAVNSKMDIEKIKQTLNPDELVLIKEIDEGESNVQIAKKLGISEGATKSRIFRLREKLFKKFPEYN